MGNRLTLFLVEGSMLLTRKGNDTHQVAGRWKGKRIRRQRRVVVAILIPSDEMQYSEYRKKRGSLSMLMAMPMVVVVVLIAAEMIGTC